MSLSIKPVFVKTPNVRNFESMMRALALSRGEGRLGLVWGRAGRGKSRTAHWYAANNRGCVYVLMLSIWKNSQGEFLRKLAFELGLPHPPRRTGALFLEVAERLKSRAATVILDEPDKLPPSFLDLIRDLSDYTCTAFVLLGEEALPEMMRRHTRVWSRTYQEVQFRPVGVADIVQYVTASAGMRLTAPAAEAMFASSNGDFRIVRRDMINLVHVLNAKGVAEADEATVAAAVRMALTEDETA